MSYGVRIMKQAENQGFKPISSSPSANTYPTLAAIDLGTNSCRLLVASLSPHTTQYKWAYNDHIRVIDAFSRPVQLGEQVNQTGILCDRAMERTLTSLHAIARKIKQHRVTHIRAVATQACRQASNARTFIDRIKAETNIDIDIIDTSEEARLAVSGLSGLYYADKSHALIFDIGGGSTQIIWAKLTDGVPEILDNISIPLGVVSLTDSIGTGRLTDNEYRISVNFMQQQFADFHHRNTIADYIANDSVQVIGTSGTITTICAIHKNLHRYNRTLVDGEVLPVDDMLKICDNLRHMDLRERIAHPCLGPEWAPLMLSGCIILSAICQQWHTGTVRIADRSVREGILYDLYRESLAP